MNKRLIAFKYGLHNGIPICLGYIAVSFTFGISASASGLTPEQAVFMSASNLTSAGQFAALAIIGTHAPYFEMAITQLIINLRYSLMSCALSQKLSSKTPFFHRFFIAFGVSDEIFALSVSTKGKLNPFYSYGIISISVFGWVFGTFLGAALGEVLPQRILSALGVALYGMFISIIIPPKSNKNKIISGIVGISMLSSFIFDYMPVLSNISSGFKIIILTIIIAGAAAFIFPVKDDNIQGETNK